MVSPSDREAPTPPLAEAVAPHLELGSVDDAEYVRRIYRLALRRDPEQDALEAATRRLADGTHSRASLLADLVAAEEFERVRVLDDAIALSAAARRRAESLRGLRAPGSCDERAIEIPWMLSRYRGEAKVLDAGYALARPAWLAALAAAVPGEIIGVDLRAAEVPSVRAVVADLRELPFRRSSFDVAFCLSTLEHVGVGEGREYRAGALAALRELRRVLGRAGRLLLSVPCGAAEDHDGFVQREPAWWLDLFADAGLGRLEHEVYVKDGTGWHAVDGIVDVRYDLDGHSARGVLCAALRR